MLEPTKQEIAKDRLHDSALRVLQDTPTELAGFKTVWAQGNEHAIFEFFDDLIKTRQCQPDAEFNKALDDFFWLCCY